MKKQIEGSRSSHKPTWTGWTAKALEHIYGRKSPADLFTAKATELIRASRIAGPPFDPRRYADFLGIEVRDELDAPFDGTLRKQVDGSFLILLNAATPEERKRFTLAHEIAHTFFYADLELHMERHSGGAIFDPEEERLCDIGAAELLMPYGIFKKDLTELRNGGPVTPITIRLLASRYRVSLQAACVRVARIVENLTCVYWSKALSVNSDWATPSRFQHLVLCSTGKSSVERAFFGQSSNIFTGLDSFYCNSKPMRRQTVSQRLGHDTVLSVIQPLGVKTATMKPSLNAEPLVTQRMPEQLSFFQPCSTTTPYGPQIQPISISS